MPVGVGDRGQVVLGVVSVESVMAGRVGDFGEAVGVIVGVAGDVAELVGDRGAASAGVVGEAVDYLSKQIRIRSRLSRIFLS